MVLASTIALATGISVKILYDKAIDDWTQQTKIISLILAENTAQQMTTAYLALDGIVERVKSGEATDDATLHALLASEATFQMMSDKVSSTPQIDVATIVASNGDVINFTRAWPTPAINLAERDYFKAHRDNPKLDVLVSDPVRNKGNGKWTFYISHRLDTPQGDFLGLVLLGISSDYYSDFYQRISLGGKAAITLLRDDFTILARWPVNEAILGKRNLHGSSFTVIHDQHRSEGVVMITSSRLSDNNESGHPRMGAVRTVKKYPLIVNFTIEEEVYLGAWRENTRLIVMVAVASILAILFSFILLVRALHRSEKDLEVTKRLQRESEKSTDEKSELLEALSQKQQALRDASDHMAAIVDNAPDAILIINQDDEVISCNRAALAIFSVSAEKISGLALNLLIPDPLSPGTPANGISSNFESTAIRHGKDYFPCDISKAKFQIAGQDRQVFIVRDITERKKMENAKAEFISVVSHELRTPLTAIRDSLGRLRGGVVGTLPGIGANMVAMAYQNTERLSRMINDLPDMQKMEAGKMDFNFDLYPLTSLLASSVTSNQGLGIQYDVTIRIDGDIPEVRIKVNEGRFQQAMSNLLSNACKFSRPGSLVYVRATQVQADRIRIEIHDSGPGIPAEFQDSIFQRFAQTDSSDTRKIGGSGLGLSITRDIVLLMHGNIDYTSTQDQGTTFFVSFPVMPN